jgi:predicted chitinase
MIESRDLIAIMPRCPHPEAYAGALELAMAAADINTVTRAAAFLAQIAHESGELRWLVEQGDVSRYEGRLDLGNTERGDGERFRGRGPMQLTGRANYLAAGVAIGLDLIAHPDAAADPAVGLRVACWYWVSRGCNGLADACNFEAVTHTINGGYNGLAQRLDYYHHALEVLGCRVKL